MRIQAKSPLFCFSLALLATAAWASDCIAAPKKAHPLPASIERNVDLVIDELTGRGFEVTEGYARLYTRSEERRVGKEC